MTPYIRIYTSRILLYVCTVVYRGKHEAGVHAFTEAIQLQVLSLLALLVQKYKIRQLVPLAAS